MFIKTDYIAFNLFRVLGCTFRKKCDMNKTIKFNYSNNINILNNLSHPAKVVPGIFVFSEATVLKLVSLKVLHCIIGLAKDKIKLGLLHRVNLNCVAFQSTCRVFLPQTVSWFVATTPVYRQT